MPEKSRAVILCVDDEPIVLTHLAALLNQRFSDSHEVRKASSAEAGLQALDEMAAQGISPDLVISDQLMPGMTGDRFLEEVHRRSPRTRKILLTARADRDAVVHAINHAELDRFMPKPWDTEDLMMAVGGLLSHFRAERDLERERQRLARHDAQLRELHAVSLELNALRDPGLLVRLVVRSARSLADPAPVAAVARMQGATAAWAAEPAGYLEDVRPELQARLLRSRPAAAHADPVLAGTRALPLQHGDMLLGWLLVGASASPESCELLDILADQAGLRLHNLQLVEEQIQTARLTALGRMFAGIAHDLRNPLTAIRGYAAMVDEYDLPRARQQECARQAMVECDHLNEMLDDLLEFSRRGQAAQRASEVRLDELVLQVQHALEPTLRSSGVVLEKQLDWPGAARLDPVRIRRALLNLAGNAIDAMTGGGVLRLRTGVRAEHIEISVEDTGPGIPDDVLPRVFEPFFTHGKTKGIGLGLAITHRIVEDHGGDIEVDTRPGHGTRITLRLPLAGPPIPEPQAS